MTFVLALVRSSCLRKRHFCFMTVSATTNKSINEHGRLFAVSRHVCSTLFPTRKKALDDAGQHVKNDALVLYLVFCSAGGIQKTERPLMHDWFTMKILKWGNRRFYVAKKVLKEMGVLEEKQISKNKKVIILKGLMYSQHLESSIKKDRVDEHDVVQQDVVEHDVQERDNASLKRNNASQKGAEALKEEIDASTGTLPAGASHNKQSKHVILKKANQEKVSTDIDSVDIAGLIQLFRNTVNPTLNFANTTQRRACEQLLDQFGSTIVFNMAKYAISIQSDKYAPIVTTPLQLLNNIGRVGVFKKRSETNQVKNVNGSKFSIAL